MLFRSAGNRELECELCHAGTDSGGQLGAPGPDICASCHEDAGEQTGLARELAKDWPRIKALPPDGKFSHNRHAEADVKCHSCHANISNSKKVTLVQMPDMDTSMKCHSDTGVSTDCATCHEAIDIDNAPPSHSQSWERFHGEDSRDPMRGEMCSRCHERSTCATCHQTEKPRNHNYGWRNFGHGTTAQIDRSRCATCHRTDYCVRCHKETPPVNHRAGWGPPSERHCMSCHLTGGGDLQNCAVCHGARNTHPAAPARPRNTRHITATDCRTCHSALKHPDNGDNCKTCHM